MKQKYIEIENELIKKYKILIIQNSGCRSRMHAHCDGSRRICKWEACNSLVNLFELAHEIGHIMTKTSKMRRCESEYFATVWAIQELAKYNLQVPENQIKAYQRYIYRELNRGLRRGGSGYSSKEEMDLSNAINIELKLKKIPTKKKHEQLINHYSRLYSIKKVED